MHAAKASHPLLAQHSLIRFALSESEADDFSHC